MIDQSTLFKAQVTAKLYEKMGFSSPQFCIGPYEKKIETQRKNKTAEDVAFELFTDVCMSKVVNRVAS